MPLEAIHAPSSPTTRGGSPRPSSTRSRRSTNPVWVGAVSARRLRAVAWAEIERGELDAAAAALDRAESDPHWSKRSMHAFTLEARARLHLVQRGRPRQALDGGCEGPAVVDSSRRRRTAKATPTRRRPVPVGRSADRSDLRPARLGAAGQRLEAEHPPPKASGWGPANREADRSSRNRLVEPHHRKSPVPVPLRGPGTSVIKPPSG